MSAIKDNQWQIITGSLVVSISLALAGCGGGGGSDSGSTPGNDEPDSLTFLSGLSGDAGNQDLLYFTSPLEGNDGLFAVNPALPADPPVRVDGPLVAEQNREFLLPNAHSRNYFPIHEADWDADQQAFTDFRVDRILYFDKSVIDGKGVFTVSTAPQAASTPDPRRTTSLDFLFLEQKAQFINSIENADETALIYTFDFDEWFQFRMGDDSTTAPLTFAENLVPVAPSFNPQTARGDGWLVVDTSDNNTLKMVDSNLELVQGTVTHDGSPMQGMGLVPDDISPQPRTDTAVQPLGPIFADGSRLLVMVLEAENADATPEDGIEGSLWHYAPGAAGTPGTVSRVLNGSGETYTFASGLLSLGGVALPSDDQIAIQDDTLFFKQAPLLFGDVQLYRAGADGWSLIDADAGESDFLTATDGRVVWVNDDDEVISFDTQSSNRLVIDSATSIYGQRIKSPVLGTRDGWIFYNREDRRGPSPSINSAVAAKADGSDVVEVQEARWIGASTSGRGSSGSLAAGLELSEVFMLRNDTELLALSAATPGDGVVRLGNLPSGAVDARLFGNAPGPHRLLQTEISGSPVSHEVIYINTRQEGSLTTVSPQAAANAYMRPVQGF